MGKDETFNPSFRVQVQFMPRRQGAIVRISALDLCRAGSRGTSVPEPISPSFAEHIMMDTRSGNPDGLKGLNVFVVEDEAAIALLLEDMLADFGCEIVGPAGRVDVACDMARAHAIDVALLDVNVAGQTINPVVEALAERSIPIVFSTGYGRGLDERFRGVPVLEKPFTQADLERKLLAAVGRHPST